MYLVRNRGPTVAAGLSGDGDNEHDGDNERRQRAATASANERKGTPDEYDLSHGNPCTVRGFARVP